MGSGDVAGMEPEAVGGVFLALYSGDVAAGE